MAYTPPPAAVGDQTMSDRTSAPQGEARRLLTLKDAAALLSTSTATVRRLVSTGKLPAVRITRRVQIDMQDLERLVDRSKVTDGFDT